MDDAVDRVLRAIDAGELQLHELTARRIGTFLGKTTSVLYHHWGSLDVFLYDVSQAGHLELARVLAPLPPCEMAEAYVRFAVARPALYELMFHRRWDWAALRERRDLRASVGFGMWQALVQRLAATGSADPDTDARILYAALHGIASLAIAGRANVGNLERTDLETAIHAARRLVDRLLPESPVKIAQPLTLPCGVVLPNRLAKSAMSERLAAADVAPNERHVTLYRRWAEGGLGLSITGNVMIDRNRLGEPGNVAFPDDPPVEAWSDWARAATTGGAAAWVQLNHPGRQAPRSLDPHPVAPSPIGLQGTYGAFAVPRALEDAEIEAIVERFGVAAAFVAASGFGGVQLHAAHGYLVNQFLSPRVNTRTDRWGGSLEGRARFLLAVVRAMRSAVGPTFPVGVKLNTADFQRGGFDEADAIEVASMLEAENIDLLELSGGTYEKGVMFGEAPPKASTRSREAFFLEQAERVRARVKTPLMLTGGFRTVAGMEEALDSGAVDVIGLARPLAVEPDLPGRLLSGAADRAVPVKLHTGLSSLDAIITGSWYQVQLERLADGRPSDPQVPRWSAAAWYVRDLFRGARP